MPRYTTSGTWLPQALQALRRSIHWVSRKFMKQSSWYFRKASIQRLGRMQNHAIALAALCMHVHWNRIPQPQPTPSGWRVSVEIQRFIVTHIFVVRTGVYDRFLDPKWKSWANEVARTGCVLCKRRRTWSFGGHLCRITEARGFGWDAAFPKVWSSIECLSILELLFCTNTCMEYKPRMMALEERGTERKNLSCWVSMNQRVLNMRSYKTLRACGGQ